MRPSVGRMAHYVSYGTPGGEYPSVCRAAIMTEVPSPFSDDSEAVSLCVLSPEGQFFNRHVPHDEETKAGGTWHWPERVD